MSWPKTSTLLLLYGPEITFLLDLLITSLSDLPLSSIPSCSWALLLCQAGGRKLFIRAVWIIVGSQGAMDWKRGGQGAWWCQGGSCHDGCKIAMPKISLTCDSQIHSYLLWYVFIVREPQNGFPPLGPYSVVIMKTWKEGKKKRNVLFRKRISILPLLKLDISDTVYVIGFRVSLSHAMLFVAHDLISLSTYFTCLFCRGKNLILLFY